MGAVLGLALTAEKISWALVDDADGAVADHDVIDIAPDTEIGGAAARGARAIATNGGVDVQRIRLTWTDDVAPHGLRLRTRLTSLDLAPVDTVPYRCAAAVLVDPEMDPAMALAYGAACAPSDGSDGDAASAVTARVRVRRRTVRIAAAILGTAAAAAVGGLLLTSGTAPQVEQAASVASEQTVHDPGWVAVPAPTDGSAGVARKVVEWSNAAPARAATPAPVRRSTPSAPVVAPAAAPAAVADVAPPAAANMEPPAAANMEPPAAADVEPAAAANMEPPAVLSLPEAQGVPHLAAPPAVGPEAVAPAAQAVPGAAADAVAPQAPGTVAPAAGLPDAAHLHGTSPGVDPEMTDLSNLFTALP